MNSLPSLISSHKPTSPVCNFRLHVGLLSLIITASFLGNSAQADLILSLAGNTVFNQGADSVSLDVVAHSPDNDVKTSFTVDFTLDYGLFEVNENGFGDGGGFAKTGDFGKDGFIAFNNLQPTSYFVFDPGDRSFASLSMDFSAEQAFPESDQLLMRLTIDTTGLPAGNYGISVSSGHTATTNLGSFSIAAVPEPSSFALLSFIGSTLALRRRKRDVKLAGSE